MPVARLYGEDRMRDYGCRTPRAASLALQSMAYRAMGAPGMTEDAPLDVIPVSLRKRDVDGCEWRYNAALGIYEKQAAPEDSFRSGD